MTGRLYRRKARRKECTNHRAGREECTEGRQGGKIVLIIGHKGKNVPREGKERRMY